MKHSKIFFTILLAVMAILGKAQANNTQVLEIQKEIDRSQEMLEQGVLAPREQIQNENFTKQLMATQHMVDSEDVIWAHRAYQEALVGFHKSLPHKSQYQIIVEGLALELKESYNSWVKITNEKLEYMDSFTFEKFYWNRKNQLESHKGKHQKRRRSGWSQLEKLRSVGQTLDIAVQNAHENLQQTELIRSKEYYTDCVAYANKSGEFIGWDKYSQLVKDYEVPVQKFTDAVKTVQKAKHDYQLFMQTTPGLKELRNDEDFHTHFLRGISANQGLPKASMVQQEHQQFPDNKLIGRAYDYIKNINESDRLKFNALFKHTLDSAQAWAAAAREMDEALLQLGEQIKQKEEQDKDVLKANAFVVEAIEQRQQLNRVWQALQVVNQRAQAAQYHSSIYHQQINEQEEFAFTFKLILNTVLILGGCIFCSMYKKQFFSDEDSMEDMEGGEPEPPQQSQRKLFKKQMKSLISSNSRQHQESLMQQQYTGRDDYV